MKRQKETRGVHRDDSRRRTEENKRSAQRRREETATYRTPTFSSATLPGSTAFTNRKPLMYLLK